MGILRLRVSPTSGTVLGEPRISIIAFWGLCSLGSPYLENDQVDPTRGDQIP